MERVSRVRHESTEDGGKKDSKKPSSNLKHRVSELERLLSESEKKASYNFDQLQRMQADFINYKKIAEREKADAIKYGNEKLILDLLDVIESLDKAIESPKDCSVGVVEGLKKVSLKFRNVLKSYGLSELKTDGEKFNEVFHEAVDTRFYHDKPEGLILEEVQRGYTLKDRVLRPAKVIVSVKETGGEK